MKQFVELPSVVAIKVIVLQNTHIYLYLHIYPSGRFSAVKRQLSWPLLDSVADTSLALRPAADKVSLIDIWISTYLNI